MCVKNYRGRILIADDDLEVVEMLKDFFLSKNYDVITAYDGREALDKIHADKPDILLLDLKMPEVDGEEILRHIEEQEIDICVIIITGYPEYIKEKKLLERCYDYIIKPFDFNYLNTTVLTKVVMAFNDSSVN